MTIQHYTINGRMILHGTPPRLSERVGFYRLRRRLASGSLFPGENDDFHPCSNACHLRVDFVSEMTKVCQEVSAMKVVVVRSPRALKGILKLIFKISDKDG